jgi:hypothetical protein
MRGLREIDRILRGDVNSSSNLRERGIALQFGHVIFANILLAAFAGACLGVFGVANREEPEFRFMLADAIKVPLLLGLTLAITFPSLYVFNALVGSPLSVAQLGHLMAATLSVLVVVLASFGPIVAFFSITSTSYPFILLLTVAVFIVASGFAMNFLWRTIVNLTIRPAPPPTIPPSDTDHSESVHALNPVGSEQVGSISPVVTNWAVVKVFAIWIVAFALVGTQMSWVLRPFIGAPQMDFTWLRPRHDSFFEAVAKAIRLLLFGA